MIVQNETTKIVAAWMLPVMMKLADSREPDFQVVRNDSDVYLRRWWVVPRNDDCNVYLHNMLKDDDTILHDHMYDSVSLVLTDGIDEVWCENPGSVDNKEQHPDGRWAYQTQRRTIEGGSLVFRSANMAHQLIVTKPAWTLFVTGPRVKPWGFWCPKGFRDWKDYVAVTQDPSVKGNGVGTSGIGVGCGEQS